jgi:hypothetical protein
VGEFAATKPAPPTLARRITKALPYAAALVLVAGGIAFLIAHYGNTAHVKKVATPPGKAIDNSGVPRNVSVAKGAKVAAGQFILTAMTRQNLAKSWTLLHPEFKKTNELTRKAWMTGNIPVDFFPAKGLAGVTYNVTWSHPNDVLMDVYVLGKGQSASLSQSFYIELKALGQGKSKRWLVSYEAPSAGGRNVPALGATESG